VTLVRPNPVRMLLVPIFVEKQGVGFVQYREEPVYPPSPCGERLYRHRRKAQLKLSVAAHRAGITELDLLHLELGKLVCDSDEGWRCLEIGIFGDERGRLQHGVSSSIQRRPAADRGPRPVREVSAGDRRR
jgi:hypothetical protein